jgi:hypothetical protein
VTRRAPCEHTEDAPCFSGAAFCRCDGSSTVIADDVCSSCVEALEIPQLRWFVDRPADRRTDPPPAR